MAVVRSVDEYFREQIRVEIKNTIRFYFRPSIMKSVDYKRIDLREFGNEHGADDEIEELFEKHRRKRKFEMYGPVYNMVEDDK